MIARAFPFDAAYVHKWEDLPGMENLLATDRPHVRMVHDHDMYCLRSATVITRSRATPLPPAARCLRCVFPCLAPLKTNRSKMPPVRWASFFKKQRELALARRFHRNIVATRYMRDELLINGFDRRTRIEIHPPVPPPAEPLRGGFTERNLLVFAGSDSSGARAWT